jgi:hypothetical protein
MKPLYHRLSQKTIDAMIGKMTYAELMEKYRQPDWCQYPEALNGMWGCWSLTDNAPGGMRTKICKTFCSGCEFYSDTQTKQSL